MKKIRCAIYTRKSAEEGLEQEFNSLDAQREACAAYVASQKAEGWVLCQLSTRTRGSRETLERPGLQRLLDHRCRSRRPDCGLQGRPTDPFPLRLCEARRPARRGQHRVCLGDPVLQHRDQHGTTDAAYAAVLRTIRNERSRPSGSAIRSLPPSARDYGWAAAYRSAMRRTSARCASTRLRPKRSRRSMRCTGSTERSGR